MANERRDRARDPAIMVRARSHSTLVVGVLAIAIGTVLLLDRMGVLYAHDVFRFWPVLLIAAGVLGMLRPDSPGKVVWSGMVALGGLLLLLHELGYLHFTWNEAWPVLLIAAGILMLWEGMRPARRWRALFDGAMVDNPRVQSYNLFGGGERRVTAHDFQGGEIVAIFGGFKLDLADADILGDKAVVEIRAIFGGGEIIVPRTWNVIIRPITLFGGYDDQTRHIAQPGAKTLEITGKLIFGGFSVKN